MTDEAKLERSAQVAQSLRSLYAGPHQIVGHAYVGVATNGELHWGSDWTDVSAAMIDRAAAHLGTMAKHATRFSGSQRVAIAKSNRGEE